MTVRVNKPEFNIREKLSELERPIGLKGSELMGAETAQEARDLVSAGRKNLIINGDMRISQRATSVSASNNTYNTLDRWNTWINYDSGGVTMSQAGATPPGFIYSLQYYNNGNATGPQYHFLEQKIEAQNIPQLKMGTSDAEYMTLSFWVRSSVTGTFNVELTDDDGSHHIIKRYTIDNAATWEYKTITIPPATNTGVPTYDNTMGLTVHWCIAGGSSYNGTSADGTWQTYSTTRRNDGGNTTFTDPDYWNITGVQLEVGKNATDFEHRPYGEELALCQRYYYNPMMDGSVMYPIRYLISTGNNGWTNWPVSFPTAMRIIPSLVSDLSDSNNTSGPPTDDQWAFYWQNQGYVSKTGNSDMSVLNIAASATHANVGAYYVSPTNTNAASIKIGANRTFAFNAEL